MKRTQPSAPRITPDERAAITADPLVQQALRWHNLVFHTAERCWRPAPDIRYGGPPRSAAELQEARDLQPVRAYLQDLAARLRARAVRRAARAHLANLAGVAHVPR